MADNIIDKSDMTGTIGTHISAMATAILREESVLAKYCRDVSQFAVKGVDKITFPKLGSFTVQNRAHGATTDKQAPAVGTDSLDLNKNAYIKYGIDGSSEIQSTLNWKLDCAKIAAEDHVDYFEGTILSTMISYATEVDVTLAEGDIEIVKCMSMARKAYRDSKAKLKYAVWVISTELEEKILSNPSLFQVAGLGSALIKDGVIEKLYGIPVEVKIMEEDFVLANGQAVNYGFQLAPNYAEQPDINFGTRGLLAAMDQLFGTGASYVTAGKSAVIFKKGTVTPAA